MKIDREHFLFLAAALATGVSVAPGCNDAQSPPPQGPNARGDLGGAYPPATGDIVAIPAQPTVAPVPSPAASPTTPTPQPGTSSSVAIAASATSSASAATGAPAKSPNPYDGTPVTAQSCSPSLNAVGSSPRCALTAPGPTCESFSDTKQECPTLNNLLKPRVASAAIDCLRRKSGTKEICEFNVTSICAYEALGSACLDPAAKAVCNGVMARCGAGPRGNYNKMSRESCEAGVSGIADSKKKKFVSCITEYCRFETCLTYL